MRDSATLTPDQEAYLGYLSAGVANTHFDALRLHRSDLRKMHGQLWDIMQEPEENGIAPSDLEDTIQLYRDVIKLTEEKIAEIKKGFDVACEEAGRRIGPGTIGERALVAVSISGSYTPPDC